jgi:hypothetical protein
MTLDQARQQLPPGWAFEPHPGQVLRENSFRLVHPDRCAYITAAYVVTDDPLENAVALAWAATP